MNNELQVRPYGRMFCINFGKWDDEHIVAYLTVDEQGYIEFWNDHELPIRREIMNVLVELELAEWRPIGPEDSELFATDNLLERWNDE